MPVMKDPAKIEKNCLRIYGCGLEQALALNGNLPLRTAGSAAHRYAHHRSHANCRGIEWHISFPDWLAVWTDSGKWHERGPGQGYVMGRTGDVGPYAIGNVYICTSSQNAKDGHANKVMHTVRRKAPESIRGYLIDPTCKTNPYRVRVAGKQIGQFSTPEEATAAYWRAVRDA